jgi:4-hydroxy-tetrahydrodipicolinate synthase
MTSVAPGAWTANLTPLNSDLSVDLGAYVAHVRWLLDRGSAGIVALGTTGEANSFSLAERTGVIKALGESGIPAERMLIGTGCCAAPDTIALTRAVLDAGFVNVLMLPPFYYKGVSDEGIFQSYARVIEGVRDSRLRVFVYDIPQQTGFKLGIELLARLRSAFEGIVVGVKNSSGDWPAIKAACALPKFQVFAGTEEYLLATLRAGGPGCISATANVTSASLAEIVAQWQTDAADGLQQAVTRVRHTLQKYPAVPALKEIMARATKRPQWRLLRPPLVNLDAAGTATLIKDAGAAGILTALGAE